MIKERKLKYYHSIAEVVATLSHDIHTQVGALLINPKTGAIMAEGFNGFVRGAPDHLLPTSRPEKYKYIIHAETNLLCNALRSRVQADDAIVYCTISPCVNCIRTLWQAGVSTIYYKEKYKDFAESAAMLDLSLTEEKIGEFYLLTVNPAST